ncbi:MAG: hypothetical protein AB1715_06090, partial [Acidobacteriota bacterium]
MKDFIALIKLAVREKKLLLLSFLSSVFVALFTYVFVNLVQPIIDNLWIKPVPSVSAVQSVPEKARFMDVIFRYLRVDDA